MDIKKILEKLDGMQAAAAKPTGPKFPGYWKGTDSAKLARKKMVGGAEESVIKELTDAAKENRDKWQLQEKFKSFKEQTPDKLETDNTAVKATQPTSTTDKAVQVTAVPEPNVTSTPLSAAGVDDATKLKAMQYLTPGQPGAPASAPGINRSAWSPELLKKYDELIKQADTPNKPTTATTVTPGSNVDPATLPPPKIYNRVDPIPVTPGSKVDPATLPPPKIYNRVDPIPVTPKAPETGPTQPAATTSRAIKTSAPVGTDTLGQDTKAPTVKKPGISPEVVDNAEMASGAAAALLPRLGTLAYGALTPRNQGQKYPWPSEGPLKGSEINPVTKSPWTKQELDAYNKNPAEYVKSIPSTRGADFKKQALTTGKPLDPETVKRYKDAISKLESGQNYNVAFIAKGLQTPEQWSGGKKLSDFTLDELKRFQQSRGPLDNAVGKYQFMQPVLFGTTDTKGKLNPGLVQQLGLKGDTKFTPEVQERIHDAYIQQSANTLSRQGIPVNPATLYSAHSIGASGTGTVLKSNPNITVADALARQHGAPGSKEHRNHMAMLTKRNPHLNTLVKDWMPRMEKRTQSVQNVQKESVVDKFLSEFKQFLEYENTQDPNKQTTSPSTTATTDNSVQAQKEKRDQQIDIATAKGTMSGLKSSIGADLDVNAAASAATKIADGQPLSGPEQSAISSLTPLIAKAAETPQTASALKTALQSAAMLSKLGK